MNTKNDNNYLEMNDSDFDKLTNNFLYKTKETNKKNVPFLNEEELKFIENILHNEKDDLKLTKKEEAIMLINTLKKEIEKTDGKGNSLNNNKLSSLMN